MSELLPSLQAADLRSGVVDYLTTTFALADPDAGEALQQFLTDPDRGIFKGPYARLRLPFKAADSGWRDSLGWYEGFTPFGHQAHAFERLSSSNLSPDKPRPLPTLVTTGTGSGKTEAFLYPILDHVLTAKRNGEPGIKALILYPMNALANDQARRLASMLTQHPALSGIRAALYTGQKGPQRTVVTPDGLITDRSAIRATPPDILLTNYKMLDQLLLRTSDQVLWQQSATSLRYLVLDEFHTYDGAQGTDVSMLLRRLGLTLKRFWPSESEVITDDARARPLGLLTPVATSATLGDKSDPAAMIDFAETVFGEPFGLDCVVTETRLSLGEWAIEALDRVSERGLVAVPVGNEIIAEINGLASVNPDELTAALFNKLYSQPSGESVVGATPTPEELLDLEQAHPFIAELARHAETAISIDDLADAVMPAGLSATQTYEQRGQQRRDFIGTVLAVISHIRHLAGREALSVDLHLWTRELTRINRIAGPTVAFRWDDDGLTEDVDADDPISAISQTEFPAIYCRHCGRSGWGVELAPTGTDLAPDDGDIRRNHASREGRFRPLLYAPIEAELAATGVTVEGLQWLWARDRNLSAHTPDLDDPELQDGLVLPVMTNVGEGADDAARADTCPSCQRPDGIRFLGSAIATLLSVAVTTIFGDGDLDSIEKKALVFTDSVQDAAHRAGFVQSRSHVFSLRNAIREAVGDYPTSLEELVDRLLQEAGDDQFKRYRLLSPEIVERGEFAPFWKKVTARSIPPEVRTRVRKRLQLDVELEFGLQSRLGRTLELTGSLAAEVAAGTAAKLEAIGRSALAGHYLQGEVADGQVVDYSADVVVRWVRGVLERMRDRGAIEHEWFRRYIENDGKRWFVSGGRPRSVGMPAFPPGRDAPGFPRVGGPAPAGNENNRTQLDVVTSPQSWFAAWTRKAFGITPNEGARLSKVLLAELEKSRIVTSVGITTASGSTAIAYQLSPSTITVSPIDLADWEAGRHLLVCDVCQSPMTGTVQVAGQLVDGPCLAARCPGHLRAAQGVDNYYRRLYNEGDVRRVVAREHTSLLADDVRLRFENGFKASTQEPDAPNVLVATPTLEMGIDIGDLSTVMLAGLPKSVASYLQRVGRAGRLTGNSLSLAFVRGRGAQLPKLGEPLSVINGRVRAPATYLDAEEILRRQYFAFLIDRRAANLGNPPREARDVLMSSEPGSFLGEVITDAETHHIEITAEFIAAFPALADEAAESLRDWADPGQLPGSSGVAASAINAVRRWNTDLDLLKYRRKAISDALVDLETAAAHPAATEEAKVELRSAKAANRMVAKLLAQHREESWISGLERHGVLPNYTLLDDSVRLDVALSWIDPDTGQFEHEGVSYERGAGIAIRELAPGAVFYAQGSEIKIDAVDLGMDGEAVRTWVLCPACGFAKELEGQQSPSACPRCGSAAIADTAQRLSVVELEHVSAEVRRDESSIGDGRDERTKTHFSMAIAADIDPANVARQWYVPDTGLGVKYLRDVTIRWLNLGRVGSSGAARMISGQDRPSQLFRVCSSCGKLDTASNSNGSHEHRAWCRFRTSPDEHVVTVGLSRTLRTQGLVVRLPQALTIGDSIALPSLEAALLLGLTEALGGHPDHLRVETTVDPVFSDGGSNVESLLIHDAVPGGTGYLAELAAPEQLRSVLERAWEIIRDCECQSEARNACHRCLLPYAPGGNADLVSRTSADRSLRLLLGVDADGQASPWAIETTDPGAPSGESVIEQYFRKLFIERTRALGATVKELPGSWGNKVQVTFPGSRSIWMLRPQVSLGPTTPDFVLERHGGGTAPIAIYTDGFAFHATPAHNRIADDAAKRRAARDLGYRVIAITWADLQEADSGKVLPVDWFSKDFAASFASSYQLSLTDLEHVTANPITALMDWMQDPKRARTRWERIAEALPVLLVQPGGKFIDLDAVTVEHAASSVLLGRTPDLTNENSSWIVRWDQAVLVAAYRPDVPGSTQAALVLDDRQEVLQNVGFQDAWRRWLRMSNLLGMRDSANQVQIMALSEITVSPQSDVSTPARAGAGIEPGWAELLDEATELESDLIMTLAQNAGIPIPEMGQEHGDGIPVSFTWPEIGVIATGGLDPEDADQLTESGWTLVDMNAAAITHALGIG